MVRIRTVLLAGALSASLSGCVTAALPLAAAAMNLVSGGGGKPLTGKQVREALSTLDEQVDPACQQLLTEHRQREQWAHTPAPAAPDAKDGSVGQAGPESAAESGPEVQQVAATTSDAPGQCSHKLVCLPGTPKPTMMMMCPNKDEAQALDKSEAGVAVLEPDVSAADTNDSAPAVVPVRPRGGVADWNWEQDPAKQL